MKLETFALERFQSVWENRVAWNISESGVHPLRVSELVSLPRSAARNDARMIVVRGKGNKERLVPLNDASRQAMADYLAWETDLLPRIARDGCARFTALR